MKYLLFFLLLMTSTLQASWGHDESLGPVARFTISSSFLDDRLAAAFLGEAGDRNYRANGTIGLEINCRHRLKAGGEYLVQDLAYHFSSGKTRRWVQQGAGGVRYSYLMENVCWLHSFDVNGYGAYAPSHRLHDKLFDEGTAVNFRRIAGSNSWGINSGITVLPWKGARISLAASWDEVKYKNKLQSKRDKSGAGVIAYFNQCITDALAFSLEGRWLYPYTFAEARLNWNCPLRQGILGVGIFGNLTNGRFRLRDTYVFGVEVNFAFDGSSCCTSTCCDSCSSSLLCWVQTPAVYLPEVLAIVDQISQSIVPPPPPPPPPPPCSGPPTTTVPFLEFVETPSTLFVLDVTPFFNGQGSPVTFSIMGTEGSVDPVTGIFSITVPATEVTAFVVGTTPCGSVVLPITVFGSS